MAKKEKNWFGWLCWLLVVVGAINWGLVGAFKWNLVEAIFGTGVFTTILYVLVGLAGVMKIYYTFAKKE